MLNTIKTLAAGLAATGLLQIAAASAQNLPPVETAAPTADYKPAHPGQTRAPGAKTEAELKVSIIARGLRLPFALKCLPDGRFLITEKVGNMKILKADGSPDKEIKGLPAVAVGGQGGLLDVNFDSNFEKDRTLFWCYSEQVAEGYQLAIAKGVLAPGDSKLENVQVIYHVKPAYAGGQLQFGSRILFDKEGNLFVSTGEHSADEMRVKAQDLNAAIGKILHLTRDGKPVPGGPFAGKSGALPEIYAYGFRSPEGMTWAPNGELWEAEFGPRGGDEINLIRPGQNYGWPVITYGIEYRGVKVGEGIQQKEGMTQPVYYWNPSISPCGIMFYEGSMFPEWKGNMFVCALSGSHIARLVIKDDKVVAEERLLADKHERWRSLTTGKDGALYGVTDNGNLYRIAK